MAGIDILTLALARKYTNDAIKRTSIGVSDMIIDDNGMLVCIMSDGTRIEVGKLPTGSGECNPDECTCIERATDEDVTALLNAIGLHDMDGIIQAVGLSVDGETIVIKDGVLSVGKVDIEQITQNPDTDAVFDGGTSDPS